MASHRQAGRLRPFYFFLRFLLLLFLFFAMLILFYSSIFRALECMCAGASTLARARTRLVTIKAMNLFIQPLKTLFSVFLKRKKKKKIFLCSFVNALEASRNTHSLIHSPHCGCAPRRATLVVICFQYDVLLNLSALTLFYNVIFICC